MKRLWSGSMAVRITICCTLEIYDFCANTVNGNTVSFIYGTSSSAVEDHTEPRWPLQFSPGFFLSLAGNLMRDHHQRERSDPALRVFATPRSTSSVTPGLIASNPRNTANHIWNQRKYSRRSKVRGSKDLIIYLPRLLRRNLLTSHRECQ